MTKALGIQFRSGIKIYDFKQDGDAAQIGDLILVETVHGEEVGEVKYLNKEIKVSGGETLKGIKKILSPEDVARLHRLKKENESYVELFRTKARQHKLDMKFVDFDISIDGEKVTFYFIAESRVDFRDMVRDISRNLKKTVLLRQMGQRDEARLLDGFGPCGQPICCKKFLTKLDNISMDMAREQYHGTRSANKVSGVCGKLMCCLAFEKAAEKKPKTKKETSK